MKSYVHYLKHRLRVSPLKSLLVISFGISSIFQVNGQEEMQTQWQKTYEHKSSRVGTGLEGPNKVSYIANDKTITVYKTSDGSVVWSKRFKDLAPKLRKIDELIPFWESKSIFLFDKKGGKDQIAVVDLNTGELLWNSDKYSKLTDENIQYIKEEKAFALSLTDALVFINARTGEELWETTRFKGSIGTYIYSDQHITAINIAPPGLKGLFKGFKNQIAKINVKSGDIVWETTYRGITERKVLTREPVYDFYRTGDKLFLELNGLQTFDFKTGAQLWAAAYDATPKVVNKPAGATAFGVYGAVAKPVRVGNDVYLIEMTAKNNQKIKKYDFNSGKLLWTSPEIKKARAIPNLFVEGDKVIIQIGGVVECQAIIRRETRSSDGTVTVEIIEKRWYPNVKPNGLQAFNTSNGALAWTTEKFKKGITNAFVDEQNVYVCSGKALYALKHQSGKEVYEVNIMSDGVGNAVQILQHKDLIAVVGEKGIATHKMADGSLVHFGKYKKSELRRREDHIVLMETPKADIASFDLNTCKYQAYNAKKTAISELSLDGKFVYVYQKKDVIKLKTQ